MKQKAKFKRTMRNFEAFLRSEEGKAALKNAVELSLAIIAVVGIVHGLTDNHAHANCQLPPSGGSSGCPWSGCW